MRVAYVVDPLDRLNASSDSTVELMRTHARQEDSVYVVLRTGLYLHQGKLRLLAQRLHVNDNDYDWFSLDEQEDVAASSFDLIALRLEPPVDSGYRLICQLLQIGKEEGVPVANDPIAIETREEKIGSLRFPHLCPDTVISSDRDTLLKFANSLADGCMLKQLNGMGGRNVYSFAPKDSNLTVAIDSMLATGQILIVQERLAAIAKGDRRVFIIAGKPYDYMLNRVPSSGSHLGNMAAGGQPEAMKLGEQERRIAEEIGASLLNAGIVFAGIDVIGGKLTEVNITCPTGLRTVRDQLDIAPAEAVVEALNDLC